MLGPFAVLKTLVSAQPSGSAFGNVEAKHEAVPGYGSPNIKDWQLQQPAAHETAGIP